MNHWYDTRLVSIPLGSLVRPLGTAGKYKPDAVIEKVNSEQIYLLEFTRTTDLWQDSLSVARVRKHDKLGYTEMIAALRRSRPGWTVELLTFVFGDRGFFEEPVWTDHWKKLSLSPKSFRNFATLAVQVAHEVADEVLTTYNGAVSAKKKGDG